MKIKTSDLTITNAENVLLPTILFTNTLKSGLTMFLIISYLYKAMNCENIFITIKHFLNILYEGSCVRLH